MTTNNGTETFEPLGTVELDPEDRYCDVVVRAAWFAGPEPRYSWVDRWIQDRAVEWFVAHGVDVPWNELGLEEYDPISLYNPRPTPDPRYLYVRVHVSGPFGEW